MYFYISNILYIKLKVKSPKEVKCREISDIFQLANSQSFIKLTKMVILASRNISLIYLHFTSFGDLTSSFIKLFYLYVLC